MPDTLIVCEYPTLFGGEKSMLSTLPFVASAGLDAVVACVPASPLESAVEATGTETVPLGITDNHGKRLPLAEVRGRLTSLFQRVAPKLIHANSLSTARLVGPVAGELDMPSIGHLRDIVKLNRAAIADLNRNRRLLAVSEATRSFHVEAGLDGQKSFALHNGVDLEQFRPRTPSHYLHEALELPEEAKLTAIIGQISLRKAPEIFLAAAQRVARAHGDVHFLVIGARYSEKEESRALETALHRVASEPPLAGRVHFLGVREDVDRLLNELTMLVHPARQEPLGRVLIEASASGTPVVTTEVGGTPEIFPRGSRTAMLVPPDDAAALADGMKALLSNSELRQKVSQAARERAEVNFDVRRAATGLIEHYLEVAEIGAS